MYSIQGIKNPRSAPDSDWLLSRRLFCDGLDHGSRKSKVKQYGYCENSHFTEVSEEFSTRPPCL